MCPHFVVWRAQLPVGGSDAAEQTKRWPESEREFMSRAKATILCIDDHWNGLIGRKLLLEQRGYEGLEPTSGAEGLDLFFLRPVDAAVLDYQSPGMNGDIVSAKMKQAKSSLPILLLSAHC